MYKIQVYLPPESLRKIRKAVEQAGGGKIGNYEGCMSWWKVRSSWVTMDGAHPYHGEVGGTDGSGGIYSPVPGG